MSQIFSDSVKHSIEIAQSLAKEYHNEKFSSAHLLKALTHRDIGFRTFLESLGKDVNYLADWAEVRMDDYPKTGKVPEAPAGDDYITAIFEEADNVRIKLGLQEVNPIALFTAICKPGVGFSIEQMKSFPVKEKEIFELYFSDATLQQALGKTDAQAGSGGAAATQSANALFKYCIDKTSEAKEGKLDPIVGRDKEVRMMIEILGRRSKPNVILTGDPGVGKTALVDGFANAINEGKVPENLKNALLFEMDMGALVAGASYKGEIEDRLKNIIKEIKQFDKAILFIDEIHTLLDPKGPAGGGAANLLKPELARGAVTVIGATTNDEYRKIIEPEQAFNRRFEMLRVEEPDIETTVKMVTKILPVYEKHHNLKVNADAIPDCVRLAKRYIKDRRLPDAAIDLLDRTMAAIKMMDDTSKKELEDLKVQLEEVKATPDISGTELLKEYKWFYRILKNKISPVLFGQLEDEKQIEDIELPESLYDYLSETISKLNEFAQKEKGEVDKADIASVVSYKSGIPIGKVQAQEQEKLMNMEQFLKKRVIGQDHALKAVADAVLESRSGLNKAGQPIGSFFFLGPTGTGKTEAAKATADFLFNDETAMIRFDMSEFKEEHSAALLYGAPPGYVGYEEGGMLVNKIRQQPYAVVLFDEIEKAHPSVFDIFLQILDEGKMHDRLGKEGDFSNALIVFTSNIGSEWIIEQFGKKIMPKSSDLMEIMTKHFRPEFLARVTEIVPFAPISEENVVKIFDIHMKSLFETLKKQGIALELSDEAKKTFAMMGFTPKYGARPITGVIRNQLRRPLSKMIISGQVKKGNTISIDKKEDEIVWTVK